MPRFRKLPAIVEAIQWDGTWDGWQKVVEFDGKLDRTMFVEEAKPPYVVIEGQPLGADVADPGDWIIKEGTLLYPVKRQVFEEQYEAVE